MKNAVPPMFGVVYVVCTTSSEGSSQGRAWDIPQLCGISSLCEGCACANAGLHAYTSCEISIARYGSVTRGAGSTLGGDISGTFPYFSRRDPHRCIQRQCRRITNRCTGRRKRASNWHITVIRRQLW